MKVTMSRSATRSQVPKTASSGRVSGQLSTTRRATSTSSQNLGALETYEAPVPWLPRAYMLAVAKWVVQHLVGAILLDPGMGKTSILLAAFCALQKAHDAKLKAQGFSPEQRRAKRFRAWIVAPRRVVHRVWPAEIAKWADFAHLSIAVAHGSPKIRERAMREDADLYVMTHDGLQWACDGGYIDRIGPHMLIIDELSKYKRGTTKRHKGLRKYLPKFERRMGATGSFTPKSLLDTWAQVYLLDLGKALGPWFTHFKTEFFNPTGYGGYTWVAKPDTERILLARLKDTCVSLNASDYIELPELVYDDIVFDLPPEVRVKYSEMEAELLTFYEDERVSAPNTAVAKAKCRQICSGGLYMGPDDAVVLHTEKLDILEDLLDQLQGAPLFCLYEWKWEAEMVQERFGSKVEPIPALAGKTSDKAADRIIAAWNNNEYALLLAQPQAMSHGLNLQTGNCCHILALTCTWDYEIFDQVLRRIWRSGNKATRVVFHRALARDTVEFDVVKSLNTKQKGQFDFVSALKMRAKNLRGGK